MFIYLCLRASLPTHIWGGCTFLAALGGGQHTQRLTVPRPSVQCQNSIASTPTVTITHTHNIEKVNCEAAHSLVPWIDSFLLHTLTSFGEEATFYLAKRKDGESQKAAKKQAKTPKFLFRICLGGKQKHVRNSCDFIQKWQMNFSELYT